MNREYSVPEMSGFVFVLFCPKHYFKLGSVYAYAHMCVWQKTAESVHVTKENTVRPFSFKPRFIFICSEMPNCKHRTF